MTTIPKTFCPAKWDELTINLQNNYVYACCKATPITFVSKSDINKLLTSQKINLQNSVQDSSCKYCWNVENNGGVSKRAELLSNFDKETYSTYTIDKSPTTIEVNLGNECNFQCIYCNPKFSSQWETDVRRKPYQVFVDRYVYAVGSKSLVSTVELVDILSEYENINALIVNGGEPLLNKKFMELITRVDSNSLSFSSNLSCNKATIDNVLSLASKYNKIIFGVSIDSTGEIAEFTRFGMCYKTMLENLNYLITKAPDNVVITLNVLMSSLTVVDISNFTDLVEELYSIKQNIHCILSYCEYPRMFSFSSVNDTSRPQILEKLYKLNSLPYVKGAESVISAVNTTAFNRTIYSQMHHFLTEFSSRKNIAIPAVYSQQII